MMSFGPLTAEIVWRVWAVQQISKGFSSWLHYFRDLIISIQQRAPCTFGWAAITLGIGPHSSLVWTGCPSFHATNGVKALSVILSTDPNQWPGLHPPLDS